MHFTKRSAHWKGIAFSGPDGRNLTMKRIRTQSHLATLKECLLGLNIPLLNTEDIPLSSGSEREAVAIPTAPVDCIGGSTLAADTLSLWGKTNSADMWKGKKERGKNEKPSSASRSAWRHDEI